MESLHSAFESGRKDDASSAQGRISSYESPSSFRHSYAVRSNAGRETSNRADATLSTDSMKGRYRSDRVVDHERSLAYLKQERNGSRFDKAVMRAVEARDATTGALMAKGQSAVIRSSQASNTRATRERSGVETGSSTTRISSERVKTDNLAVERKAAQGDAMCQTRSELAQADAASLASQGSTASAADSGTTATRTQQQGAARLAVTVHPVLDGGRMVTGIVFDAVNLGTQSVLRPVLNIDIPIRLGYRGVAEAPGGAHAVTEQRSSVQRVQVLLGHPMTAGEHTRIVVNTSRQPASALRGVKATLQTAGRGAATAGGSNSAGTQMTAPNEAFHDGQER